MTLIAKWLPIWSEQSKLKVRPGSYNLWKKKLMCIYIYILLTISGVGEFLFWFFQWVKLNNTLLSRLNERCQLKSSPISIFSSKKKIIINKISIEEMQKCNVRAFPSRESKFLIFTISKHYFLAFNTSLYNTSYIKDSIFFTASFKFFFILYMFLSLSSYMCLSLSLKTHHFLLNPSKPTPIASHYQPPPPKTKNK